MKTKQDHIDEIMDNFDFEKVHKVMTFLNWKWYMSDASSEVPSIAEMRKTVRNMINQVIDNNFHGICTGGFNVRKEVFCEGTRISVSFEVDDYDSEDNT